VDPVTPRHDRLTLAMFVATCVGLVAATGSAHAQGNGGRPLSAFGRQTLNFGTLFPGVPTSISRTDALNAGEFEIRGRKNTEIAVDFTLPAALTSGAQSVPLQFAPGDGGYSPSGTIAAATAFDPRVELVTTLSNPNGRLYVYLGGTALPGSQQRAGHYTATITLTVSYTGS